MRTASHPCEGEKDTALSPDIEKRTFLCDVDDAQTSDLPLLHAGRPHARSEAAFWIEVKKDANAITNLDGRCLLNMVQQDVVTGVPGLCVQKYAKFTLTYSGEFGDLTRTVFAWAFFPASFLFLVWRQLCIAPQAFQRVVFACILLEDVRDGIAVVEQNPLSFTIAFLVEK